MEDKFFSAIVIFSLMVPIMILSSMLVRSWLNVKKSWIIIFIAFLVLAVSGNLFPFFMKNNTNMLAVRTLILPFYSICIYKILYIRFFKIFKRAPIDTFLNFKDDIFWDSLFNAALIVMTVLLPIILMAFFIMRSDNFKTSLLTDSGIKPTIEVVNNQSIKNLNTSAIENANKNKDSSDDDKLVLPIKHWN